MSDLEICVSNTNNQIIEAMALNFQAYILYLCGKNAEAEQLFEKVEDILCKSEPEVPINFPPVSSYYCKFLLDIGKQQEALERSLKTFA